jgi:crotonobetainyl-CoA:carnitine CoA-transferase CaiB-like acyl-CoA transferase
MTLVDLGADVVKIEHPINGDDFLSVNRGKRSVALDLKDAEGRELGLELCSRADVVIENFRPGAAARLGLDYDAVRAQRPDVVYCTISGFGRREPAPDGAPMKVGVALVDVLARLNAVASILAALHHRDRSGEGELIEVSLLDSAFGGLVNVAANALATGEDPARYGNEHPSIVPYQPLRALDGWIAVAAANDALFGRLCEAIGRPELSDDQRYATNDARVRHRESLIAELEAVFELVAAPFSFTRASMRTREAPPLLGQHTAKVLVELGVGEERLHALARRGAVATRSAT